MGVRVEKVGNKYRLIDERSGEVAKKDSGKFVDGGGHEDDFKAERQAAHINHSLYEKEMKNG